MSQDVLRQRAAKIRKSWTKSERRLRGVASDIRCMDLLVRLATSGQYHMVPCRVKTSA